MYPSRQENVPLGVDIPQVGNPWSSHLVTKIRTLLKNGLTLQQQKIIQWYITRRGDAIFRVDLLNAAVGYV